jgi:sugar/nucleoside kinase (ribokinase family)
LKIWIIIKNITKGPEGADLYNEGFKHSFSVEKEEELDSTGAGDIFASAFFIHYNQIKDTAKAVNFALRIAADSVKREGLAGAPSKNDLFENLS